MQIVFVQTAKILIRLRGYAGLFISTLDAHVRRYVSHAVVHFFLNFIQADCDKDAGDSSQRTSLHIAVSQKHKRIVELLISKGKKIHFFFTVYGLAMEIKPRHNPRCRTRRLIGICTVCIKYRNFYKKWKQ